MSSDDLKYTIRPVQPVTPAPSPALAPSDPKGPVVFQLTAELLEQLMIRRGSLKEDNPQVAPKASESKQPGPVAEEPKKVEAPKKEAPKKAPEKKRSEVVDPYVAVADAINKGLTCEPMTHIKLLKACWEAANQAELLSLRPATSMVGLQKKSFVQSVCARVADMRLSPAKEESSSDAKDRSIVADVALVLKDPLLDLMKNPEYISALIDFIVDIDNGKLKLPVPKTSCCC